MRRVLALLLILSAPLAAAEGPLAEAEAPRASFVGVTDLRGDLAAFHYPRNQGDEPDTAGFQGTADLLRIEWDQIDHAVSTGVAACPHPGGCLDERSRGGGITVPNATLQSTDVRSGGLLMVFPLPTARLTTAAERGGLTAGDQAVALTHAVAPTAPDREAESRVPHMALGGTGPLDLTVEGDFILSFYFWNATATSRDGERVDVWSGNRNNSTSAGPTAVPTPGGQTRQVYVYVQGGNLTIRSIDPDNARVLLANAEATVDGRAVLHQPLAASSAGKQRDVADADELQVAGRVTLSGPAVAGADGPVWSVDIRGEGLTISADGVPLSWSAPVQTSGAAPWLLIVLVALLAAPAAWAGRRALAAQRHWALGRAESWLESGMPARAWKVLRRRAWGPRTTDAWVLGAQALADAGRHEEAAAFVEARAPRHHDPRVATFLHAYVAALRGDPDGSITWLRSMGPTSGELVAEVRSNPAFEAVRRHPQAPPWAGDAWA